jgi:hypothetical protein
VHTPLVIPICGNATQYHESLLRVLEHLVSKVVDQWLPGLRVRLRSKELAIDPTRNLEVSARANHLILGVKSGEDPVLLFDDKSIVVVRPILVERLRCRANEPVSEVPCLQGRGSP